MSGRPTVPVGADAPIAGLRATGPVTERWCAREPRSEVGTEISGPIRRLPWQSCLTGSQRSHESTAM